MTESHTSAMCCPTSRAIGFPVFLVLWGALLLVEHVVPALHPYSTALLFGAVGVTCLASFAFNRTSFCAITGPLFLLVAGALALRTAGVWDVRMLAFWPVVLIVVGVALLLDRRLCC